MRLEEILQKINTFTYFARKCLLVAVEIIWWNNCANVSKIFYCDLKIKERPTFTVIDQHIPTI